MRYASCLLFWLEITRLELAIPFFRREFRIDVFGTTGEATGMRRFESIIVDIDIESSKEKAISIRGFIFFHVIRKLRSRICNKGILWFGTNFRVCVSLLLRRNLRGVSICHWLAHRYWIA